MVKLLCNLEELQLKEELEHDLGKDEPQIEESHISNLPFLGAVVKETFRFHTPISLLVPHKSQEDVELCGFNVPKNAQKNLSYGTIGLYYIVLGTLVHGYDWKLINGQKAKDLYMSKYFGLTLHKAQSLQAITIKN
ncbi:hypothetical protein Ahy_A02g006192 [Arachis hypogaea]|uniref:Uncharacterized protein n=1 Tax=Arachis hypogaea TaxID=3818 RepID=A0A445E929_ARAHY|nr:hypothetical protein Ahy_A02g006192 [Arachis hypogaea]